MYFIFSKTEKHPQDVVYNLTSSENSTTVYTTYKYTVDYMIPSSRVIWTTSVNLVSCIYYYWILCLFYHLLPALFMDVVRLLSFKKPKF